MLRLLPISLLISFYLLTLEVKSQASNINQNIILKGKVYNKERNGLSKNTSLTLVVFNKYKLIKTNNKGEYEVTFKDNTLDSLSDSWGINEIELLFVYGEDPNITQTVILDENKLNKARNGKKDHHSPTIIKLDIKLEYEFE